MQCLFLFIFFSLIQPSLREIKHQHQLIILSLGFLFVSLISASSSTNQWNLFPTCHMFWSYLPCHFFFIANMSCHLHPPSITIQHDHSHKWQVDIQATVWAVNTLNRPDITNHAGSNDHFSIIVVCNFPMVLFLHNFASF